MDVKSQIVDLGGGGERGKRPPLCCVVYITCVDRGFPHLVVVAEDVSHERAVVDEGRMRTTQVSVEEVVRRPEVDTFWEVPQHTCDGLCLARVTGGVVECEGDEHGEGSEVDSELRVEETPLVEVDVVLLTIVE